MKIVLPMLLLLVALSFGCATPEQPTGFASVPGPSNAPDVHPRPPEPEQTTSPVATPDKLNTSSKESKSQKAIITPDSGLTGKVVTYNDAGRFVVLSFPIGPMPKVDQRLFVYRDNLKVGELKVSKWQQDYLAVADVVTGEAKPGDEVRDK